MIPLGNGNLTSAEVIATFVRERRSANHLSQSQLALLAGVGRRFISELESAKPTLQIAKVDQVLRVLGKQVGLVDLDRIRDLHTSDERTADHDVSGADAKKTDDG